MHATHTYFNLLSKSVDCRYNFWFAQNQAAPPESQLFQNFEVSTEEVMNLISNGLG